MAVALELLTRPSAGPELYTLPALDPDTIEFVGETDTLLTMCGCSASSDNPY
jgi:hypothetical protein